VKRIAILSVFLAVAALQASADVGIVVGSRQAALVVQDTRFDPAVQLVTETRAGAGASWMLGGGTAGLLTVQGALGVGVVSQSRVFDSYVYRGLALRTLSTAVEWIAPRGFSIGLEGRATLASYRSTSLLFFYPDVALMSGYAVRLGSRTRIVWSVPVTYSFREDLAYAVSAGLDARLVVDFRTP
jgi:hypothetical protein